MVWWLFLPNTFITFPLECRFKVILEVIHFLRFSLECKPSIPLVPPNLVLLPRFAYTNIDYDMSTSMCLGQCEENRCSVYLRARSTATLALIVKLERLQSIFLYTQSPNGLLIFLYFLLIWDMFGLTVRARVKNTHKNPHVSCLVWFGPRTKRTYLSNCRLLRSLLRLACMGSVCEDVSLWWSKKRMEG